MSTRKALAFSFLDRYAGLVLAIISSMFIARLLTPAEIGVFSVTMVLLSFISVLRDMGAGQYLLQEKELTPERIRATWTVQLALGWTFAIIVFAAAYPVAAFYKEPRMINLMMVLALNFAISPFGSLTYAWLMREMRFDVLAVMRFGSSLTAGIVSVLLAWKQYGPMSLALGSLAGTIVNACIATMFRPNAMPWWPGTRGIRRVLSFGSKVSFAAILNNFAGSTPELLLGRFDSMVAVGLFSRANGLVTLFNKLVIDATQSVAMPHFADQSRRHGTISPTFLRATAYVTALGWSFFLFIGIFAEPIIGLLYGPQWHASIELTKLMSLGMVIALPSVFVPIGLTSTGQVEALSKLTLLVVLQYVVTLGIGAAIGFDAIGYAFVVASAINSTVWIGFARKLLGFTVVELVKSIFPSLLVASVTGLISITVLSVASFFKISIYIQLMIAAPCALGSIITAIILTRHPLVEEIRHFSRILKLKGAL